MSKKKNSELRNDIKKYYLKREPLKMRQLKHALNESGILTDFEEAINDLPNNIAIEWRYADVIHRYDEWLVTVVKELNISKNKMDEIFYTGYSF